MNHFHSGSIELICGPMFSGKTEELIRRVRRAQIAKQDVQLFKPELDNRYAKEDVVSHTQSKMPAQVIQHAEDILTELRDTTRVVAVDEVQFFDHELVRVVSKLANRGLRILLAGLDQDSQGRPFGPMGDLLCTADSVLKISAICTVCGGEATKTHRISEATEQILVGEAKHYEARCRFHWRPALETQITANHVTNSQSVAPPHS